MRAFPEVRCPRHSRRGRVLLGRPSPIRLRMAGGTVDRGFLRAIHKMLPHRTNSRRRQVAPDWQRTGGANLAAQDDGFRTGMWSIRDELPVSVRFRTYLTRPYGVAAPTSSGSWIPSRTIQREW